MKRMPRDINELGKLIADIATDETEDEEARPAKAKAVMRGPRF